MFHNEGDGVVFRGANGPWKTGDYDFHLKAPAAKNLLALVLKTYSETHGGPPKELFIHGQTYFNDEEWNAFLEVTPKETNVIGVRIRSTGGKRSSFGMATIPCCAGPRSCSMIRRPISGRQATCRSSTPILGRKHPIRCTLP